MDFRLGIGDVFMKSAATNAAATDRGRADPTVGNPAVGKSFDYDTAAELFNVQGRMSGRRSCGYRRFDRAADAVRFAVEELPPKQLAGAYLEVDEARFDSNAIRRLYDSADYPLARKPQSA
jgi:hypothetical protein